MKVAQILQGDSASEEVASCYFLGVTAGLPAEGRLVMNRGSLTGA